MKTIITLALQISYILYGNALAKPTPSATTNIPIMRSPAPISAEDLGALAHYEDAFLSAHNGTGGYRTIMLKS